MKNVAITGAGGYLGKLLLERLNREEEVELIAGIDLKAPHPSQRLLKFFGRDVRQPLTDIFVGNNIDTAFHLAFSVTPVHEEDLAELAKGRHRGVFNAAADGGLRYTEIIRALKKPCLTLPGGILAWLTRVSWKLRLQSRSPGGVELLMHPVNVNTEKLKKATGFQCKYTGQQAFMSFINSRKSM